MESTGNWPTLYSMQNIFKLLGSVLPFSLLLVRMRSLYQTPWDNSNDTKHDCKYHLHSCRTLYSTIDHSEWVEWREGWWGEGRGWKGTKAYVREAFSSIFSQWDVETDVCMLIHCVCVVHLRSSKCLRFCNSYRLYRDIYCHQDDVFHGKSMVIISR